MAFGRTKRGVARSMTVTGKKLQQLAALLGLANATSAKVSYKSKSAKKKGAKKKGAKKAKRK